MNVEPHIKEDPCYSRPPYRDGKKKTVIKSFSISNESFYLIIFGVPAIGLKKNIKNKCKEFGEIDRFYQLTEHVGIEKFTEAFVCKYNNLSEARYAKRKLDDFSFFGNILHVTFAPELETVAECRLKLHYRRNQMRRETNKNERFGILSCIPNSEIFGSQKLTPGLSEVKEISAQCNPCVDLQTSVEPFSNSIETGFNLQLNSKVIVKDKIPEQPIISYQMCSFKPAIVPARVLQNQKRENQTSISHSDHKKLKTSL